MVRPIEISDSLTKAETVQRLQQNQKVLPEAAHHFQKTYTDKLSEQVKMPNPVPQGDQVVLHVDEREEEKKNADHEDGTAGKDAEEERNERDGRDDGDAPPQGHIDIKV